MAVFDLPSKGAYDYIIERGTPNPITVIEQILNANSADANTDYPVTTKIAIRKGWYPQTSSLTIPKGNFEIEAIGGAVFYTPSGSVPSMIDFDLGAEEVKLKLKDLSFRRASGLAGSGLVFATGPNQLQRLDMDNVTFSNHLASISDLYSGPTEGTPPPAGSVGLDLQYATGQGPHFNWRNVRLLGWDQAAKLDVDHLRWYDGVASQCNSGLWLGPSSIRPMIQKFQFYQCGGYPILLKKIGGESETTDCQMQRRWLLEDFHYESNVSAAKIAGGWTSCAALIRLEQVTAAKGMALELRGFTKDYQARSLVTNSESLIAAPNDRLLVILDDLSHYQIKTYHWNDFTSEHVHETRFIAQIPAATALAAGDNAQVMRHTIFRLMSDTVGGGGIQVRVTPLTFPDPLIQTVWAEDYSGTTPFTIRLHVYCSGNIATLAANLNLLVELKMGLSN